MSHALDDLAAWWDVASAYAPPRVALPQDVAESVCAVLALLGDKHRPMRDDHKHTQCAECKQHWPCDLYDARQILKDLAAHAAHRQ